MDFNKLFSDLEYMRRYREQANAKINALQTSIDFCNKELESLQKRKELVVKAREFYKRAIDNTYNMSISELENLLNDVVSAIFYDKNYFVRMDLTDKYNKSLSFWLYDEDKDLLTPLSKPGTGKGVKTVVSAVIYAYYLLKFNAPYLFLDETFVNIDASYVSYFFTFMKELCKDEKLTMVLISHDERFAPFADVRISVNDGICKVHDSTSEI